jgi:MFS family permease
MSSLLYCTPIAESRCRKTDGMDVDLGFKGNQYNTMLSIFYVPYVIFAPPIGMLGKKYGPHRVLPIMMFCFGSATLLSASVQNWSGMMALRWFLGEFLLQATGVRVNESSS